MTRLAMVVRDRLLCHCTVRQKVMVLAVATVASLLVAWVHVIVGLAYDFHVFFALPVVAATWVVGTKPGYLFAFLTTGLWTSADWALDSHMVTPDWPPLVFNMMMRLAIFCVCAWLLGHVRTVLHRESRLARIDELTGLPNRRAFIERGQMLFNFAQRQSRPVSCVVTDLDGFKYVNDTYGHPVGDRVLVSVGEVLARHVRSCDVAGRLGGDEFALVLSDMDRNHSAAFVARLRGHLRSAMRTGGWPITFSVGVVNYREAPTDIETALTEADRLMYVAKASGDCVVQRWPHPSYRDA